MGTPRGKQRRNDVCSATITLREWVQSVNGDGVTESEDGKQ
jgi:hypothetical protein